MSTQPAPSAPIKVGVYLCTCGTNISDKVDPEAVKPLLASMPEIAYIDVVAFSCSEDGKASIKASLTANKPDRMVIAACSIRDHEQTFRGVMADAGMNPFLMQMVNVREHVAWVTNDPKEAVTKAAAQIRAGIRRVVHHAPLTVETLDVDHAALVIGAGPAGLKAALTLAEAGRPVTLVDRSPIIGGAPIKFDEVAPRMECGPCMLEPIEGEVLHGPHHDKIRLMTMTEVVEVKGSFGNFIVTLRRKARMVDTAACIGCQECLAPCPVSVSDEHEQHLGQRKAMAFAHTGGLPNVPYIDQTACTRGKGGAGDACDACQTACPIPGCIDFTQQDELVEIRVGAIVVAVGSSQYDLRKIPGLGYGTIPDVVTAAEFERIAATTGPTQGAIRNRSGQEPKRVVIVHCAGSLDERHCAHCSGTCCSTAFKFNHILAKKLPGVEVVHLYKTIVAEGKDAWHLYHEAWHAGHSRFIQYHDLDQLTVGSGATGAPLVQVADSRGGGEEIPADLVILMPPTVGPQAGPLAGLLGIPRGKDGFFTEGHHATSTATSPVRGIYLAGSCQAPGSIAHAFTAGSAAAGGLLSTVVPGRSIDLEPAVAEVDARRCSGCRSCIEVCPYQAIARDEAASVAVINPALCVGCGTCVAACPAGAITGKHFTDEQIFAEIEEALV
jgi:heterodisulfide reductase subunit A